MFSAAQKFFIGLFFHPDSTIAGSPAEYGLAFDELRFPASDGHTLQGLILKANGSPKGTVVHCHGNTGNLTSHFQLTIFLVKAGYNVFTFDYSGYGTSEGVPSPEGIVRDAMAAIRFVKSRPDVDSNRLVLFGQSLGGAAAAGAMARDPSIRCLILEATFTTYRDMAFFSLLGRILFFLTPFVIPSIGPIRELDAIAPRPVLFVHGVKDTLVPTKFSERLFDRARGKKSLCLIRNLHHLDTDNSEPEYQRAILDFLTQNLTVQKRQ